LNKNKSYHIHCAGGYRSVIAISLLKKNGYTNLIDVAGGFTALSETAIPKTTYVCPTTLK
jgi:rhodanese-related sulfurtransferase